MFALGKWLNVRLADPEAAGTEADEHSTPPEILVSVCSLELGMFTQRIPGLDTIGVGTELLDVHSPRERMNHKSVARVWPVIKDVMKSLDE